MAQLPARCKGAWREWRRPTDVKNFGKAVMHRGRTDRRPRHVSSGGAQPGRPAIAHGAPANTVRRANPEDVGYRARVSRSPARTLISSARTPMASLSSTPFTNL